VANSWHLVNSSRAERAVAQLGSALEWGSRGRGFKSRRPDYETSAIVRLCSMSMFFEAVRQVAATLDHVRTSATVSGGIIPATPKRHATAFHGFWCTVRAFRTAPKPREKNGIINQGEVAMNSTDWIPSAVAAATGRGFKSRRPDFVETGETQRSIFHVLRLCSAEL
jgi:hypothetical protein